MAFPYSAGDVLTAADLNASSGLVFIKSQTVGSGVSSVTVSGAFSSTFDNYRITYTGGTASSLAALNLRIGAATSNYAYVYRYLTYSAGTELTNNSASSSYFLNVGENATSSRSILACDVFGPNTSTVTRVTWIGPFQAVLLWGSGVLNDTTQHTSFVLLPTGGTMTGGTIRVYGYNNG